jgi:hypothetical protein
MIHETSFPVIDELPPEIVAGKHRCTGMVGLGK